MPVNLRPSGNRPSSHLPARTKRSPSAIRRQAASAEHDREIGDVVVEHRRDGQDHARVRARRQVGGLQADAVDGADLELGQQLDLRGRQAAMPWLAAPRIRSATGASAAALSGASQTLWTTNSFSSASSTNGRWTPMAAISTGIFPPRCWPGASSRHPPRGPGRWAAIRSCRGTSVGSWRLECGRSAILRRARPAIHAAGLERPDDALDRPDRDPALPPRVGCASGRSAWSRWGGSLFGAPAFRRTSPAPAAMAPRAGQARGRRAAARRPAAPLPAKAAARLRRGHPAEREDGAGRPRALREQREAVAAYYASLHVGALPRGALRRAGAGPAGRRPLGDRRCGARHRRLRDLPCRCRGRHRAELSVSRRPIRRLHRTAALLWKAGARRNDPLDVMAEIAQRLEDEEIRALALYFARVRPPPAALSSPIPAEPIPPPPAAPSVPD